MKKTISFNRTVRRGRIPVVQQARWRRNTRLARASAARHRIRRGQRTLFWCRRDQDRPLHDYGRERQHRRESRDAEPRRCLYRRNDTRFGNGGNDYDYGQNADRQLRDCYRIGRLADPYGRNRRVDKAHSRRTCYYICQWQFIAAQYK